MENEFKEIRKAIIPVAGLATRFLPLSKAVPKEFLPLVDKPSIQYIIEEVKKSGIKEVVFVAAPGQKGIAEYFAKNTELEKILAKRKKEEILKDLLAFEDAFSGINFSFVVQKEPKGDGHAILQAASKVKGEPVINLFGDDVFDSYDPAALQLINIYNTCHAPVLALKRLPAEKISAYGSVAVEKIANGLFKVKKIIEKPTPDQIASDLVVVGRHVLTPDVFTYLRKATPSKKGEIILAEVIQNMLEDGKVIYGYELRGEWLECGDKAKWLKSFFYMALKDDRFKNELKQYLKTIK